jgi:hypothetical protein
MADRGAGASGRWAGLTRLLPFLPRERSFRVFAAAALGFGFCIGGGALRARNFPVDDTYIHLSYGIDFKPSALFSFQGFQRDTGTSSWTWTLLCILVAKLHLPEYPVLTVLCVSLFSFALWLVMDLVLRALPRELPVRAPWAYASALLVAASGNVIWLSNTGMETALSIVLLLLFVPRLLDGGMTVKNGILALALIWTRIEGVVWLATAAALLPFTGERGARRERRGWLIPLAGVILYCGYNLAVGGHFLPTSGLSKRATFIPGGHDWKQEWLFVRGLAHDYLGPWAPGWSVEAIAATIAGAVLIGFGIAGLVKRRLRDVPRLDPAVAAAGALLGGAFVHALLNVVEFRSAYHHMRYFAPMMYLVPALGLTFLLRAVQAITARVGPKLVRPRAITMARWMFAAIGVPVFLGGLINDLWRAPAWARIYLRNAEQLGAVHLTVGRWLRDHAPEGAKRVASFDIGALRWASHLEIVDMAGTSDARTLDYRIQRKEIALIRDTHADLYISIENGFDYLPATQPAYDLELMRTWASPEYFDPYPPHSKRMVLYRINHCGEPRKVRSNVGPAQSFDFMPTDQRARNAAGTAEGTAFTTWPVVPKDLGRSTIYQTKGRFLSTDASPLRDRATGRFETVPMRAEGDFLSFRIAGGHDPQRLRVELRSGGAVLASWTGYENDVFIEIVHPIAELRGQWFTLALVDEATGRWGHLMLDDVLQFVWKDAPPKPCPKK